MPDNWGFVIAAYGLAALVLGGYWRRLQHRERESRRIPRVSQRTAARTAMRAQPRSGPGAPAPHP
jgi:hypothetical protein